MKGTVQTVLGPIDPETVGATMMHEHILFHAAHIDKRPQDPALQAEFDAPLSFELMSRIRYAGVANRVNCTLDDVPTAIKELNRFVGYGGRTIVDATSIGIGRDPCSLAKIAEVTGLNIIMGCSYYLEETYPESHRVQDASEDEIVARIVSDLTDGVDGTGIKAGVIGEVGCSWPITQCEVKVLRASARAQRQSGALLMIHPGRNLQAPFEILDILRDADADISRIVMCHVDRTLSDRISMRRLADSGLVVEFDLFGNEGSFYAWHLPIDMPNDGTRVDHLKWLVAEGFGDRLVVAHDIAFKDKLVSYGGQGYGHILENVVPLMRRKGFTEGQLKAILVDTPRRLLTKV